MRYSKTFYQFALVAMMLFLVSCSSHSKKSYLVKSAWRFSEVSSPDTSLEITSAINNNRGFLVDQTIKFNEDNTFDSRFTDPGKNSQGNWEMNSDETKITLFSGENKMTWDIRLLNESVFEIKRYDDGLGADLIFHYTIQ